MTLDTLEEYGMARMDDGEIEGFLSSQSVGVLGLPSEEAPVMRPISFWFDDGSGIYFVYVHDEGGRKRELSDRADVGRFLVYRTDTAFNWTSVLLTGPIETVPEREHDDVTGAMEMSRRPAVFERASSAERTELYRFRIEEQHGIKHRGLPPGLETDVPEPETG